MKKYFRNFKVVLLVAALMACMAYVPKVFPASASPPGEKPLSFKSTDFPSSMVVLMQRDNGWMQSGDFVYSIYTDDSAYYACWDVGFTGKDIIVKAFNTDTYPVKTGLSPGEVPVWGFYRINKMCLLKMSTYKSDGLLFGRASPTGEYIEVADNKYYSLDPVWPDITELKIKPPIAAGRFIPIYNLIAYRPLMPLYVDGVCRLEICEGSATVRQGKFFNDTQIKFTAADIARGYIRVIIRAKALANSTSTNTYREYKIYWSA